MKLNRSLWESVNNSLCPEPDNKNFTSVNFPEIGIFEQYSNEKLEEEYSKRLLEVMKTEKWPYGDRTLMFLAREMKKRYRSGKVLFNKRSNILISFGIITLSIAGLFLSIGRPTLGFILIAFGSSLYIIALSYKQVAYSADKNTDKEKAKAHPETKHRLFLNDLYKSVSPTFRNISGTLAGATIIQYFQQIYSGCWMTGTLSVIFALLFVFDKLGHHNLFPRAKHLIWLLIFGCFTLGLFKSGLI
jgi:hypothetical protein